MTVCPVVADDECNFMPGSKCFYLIRDQKNGNQKPCETCETVSAYWRKKTIEVFHNPICLFDCADRVGPSCPYTRGDGCTEYVADILLVYPPFQKLSFVSSIPVLSAYLKSAGFKVDALDSPTLGLSIEDILNYVRDTKPRSVGVSIPFTPLARSGLDLVVYLNEVFPDLPLIVGGVHPTLCPDEFTDYAYVCQGEGETALVDFLLRVKGGADIPRIIRKPVEIKNVQPPDWGSVEADKYHLVLPTGDSAFPIQTSRGCPFDCVFCSSGILFGHRVHYKTIPQVATEIANAIDQFGIKCISFRDENFTLNRARFIELCAYLRKWKISWWAQTRANIMDKELADIAVSSGCLGFSIGVETGDAYVMKKIKKGVTLEEVEEAFKVLKAANLRSCALFMVGHPWDTIATVNRTVDFADKIDPDYFGIVIATPYPGTEFRSEAIRQGTELSENWGDYETNKVTYTPPGLEGYDLKKLLAELGARWYWRKPKRILVRIAGYKGFKAKLRFLRRITYARIASMEETTK